MSVLVGRENATRRGGGLVEHERVQQVRTVMELGVVVQEARRRRQWTQAELARRAQVSRRWIVALESGQAAGAELARVLAALSALDLRLTLLLPPAATADGTAGTASPAGQAPDPAEASVDADQDSWVDLDAHLTTFMSDDASPDDASPDAP
jgi:transcriptional regulator with XRE-family HTH domain